MCFDDDVFGKAVHHAEALGTLSGEEECERHSIPLLGWIVRDVARVLQKFGRNEIINQDAGRQDIARNSQTEQHNKTLFRRFMPEHPTTQVCARPTAEQGRQEQAVFGNAAFSRTARRLSMP